MSPTRPYTRPAGGRLLRPRPDAAAALQHARARGRVPRAQSLIGRGQLARAAAWQLLFAARGARAETVRKAAEDGLMILEAAVGDLRGLVADAMEPVLKPLVYREALELVAGHRERGEPVYIVSATLQEIVEARRRARLRQRARLDLRDRRRMPGALAPGLSRGGEGGGDPRAGRRARLRPGRLDRVLRQPHRPAVPRGWSDVVVNPDRELRRIADERGWPVRTFAEPAYPAQRRMGAPLRPGPARGPARARRRRGGLGGPATCGLRSGSPRSASPRPTPP